MKIENVMVCGFEPAMRDMRNPLESWDRSDSEFRQEMYTDLWVSDEGLRIYMPERPYIGNADLELACKLIRSGGSHRKFMREIVVWWTITIPRSVWQELDTYKVATVRNSCSTMHKLGSRDLTPDDFQDGIVLPDVLERLNHAGSRYRQKLPYITHACRGVDGVDLLRYMKAILPEGYLQTAGYVFNYETALHMHHDRKTHRMKEWSGEGGICHVIRSLPYMEQFLAAAEME